MDKDGDGRLSVVDFAQLEVIKKKKKIVNQQPQKSMYENAALDMNDKEMNKKVKTYKKQMKKQDTRMKKGSDSFHLNLGAGEYCPCCDPDVCDCIFCCLCCPLLILS